MELQIKNQTAHLMVSLSLNAYYTKQHLQHPTTALFTLEPLKLSSKHGITTTENCSNSANA